MDIKFLGIYLAHNRMWEKQEMIKQANLGILSLKIPACYGVPIPHLFCIFFYFCQTAGRICLSCLALQSVFGPEGPPGKDPIPSSSGSV